jgi:LacI family transcriptional regulator
MSGKTTIKDVAKKAGVSIATVSFVLNNHPGEVISDKVKRRVQRVARQLDYHPSAAAAGLARKRTKNLSVIFYRAPSMVANQFYSYVIEGIIKETIERDYNILFSYVNTEYKSSDDLPKIIHEKNTDGVLFIREISPKMVRDIESRGIPVVAIDNFPPLRGLHTVLIDNQRGGELAAEHLIGLGHRRIGMLTATLERPSLRDRSEAFARTLIEAGIPFDKKKQQLLCHSQTYDGGYDRALTALTKDPQLTAFFCANDEIAVGAMRAAHETGRVVPNDVSFIGFDDVILSRFTYPPLTTVAVRKEELGRRAIQRLLEQIQDPKKKSGEPELVPVDLVVRGTTAPAALQAPTARSRRNARVAAG